MYMDNEALYDQQDRVKARLVACHNACKELHEVFSTWPDRELKSKGSILENLRSGTSMTCITDWRRDCTQMGIPIQSALDVLYRDWPEHSETWGQLLDAWRAYLIEAKRLNKNFPRSKYKVSEAKAHFPDLLSWWDMIDIDRPLSQEQISDRAFRQSERAEWDRRFNGGPDRRKKSP